MTRLLHALRSGDARAGDELLALVYGELHGLARMLMERERDGHTLQPTALVHEAWLRLGGGSEAAFEDRAHFLRIAARAMRRVLVDHARRRAAGKRIGAALPLDEDGLATWGGDRSDVLAVDEALERLEARDPQSARIVELRFFAGLTAEETARSLGLSVRQVEGGWVYARGWLRRELARGLESEPPPERGDAP